MIDVQDKKKKIINFLKESGPSLPVQIARKIEMEPMFTSAILSELLEEKAIKTSNMRIGASPLYLLAGQEEKLEEKSENLKSAEKEAQEKLKTKKVLSDEQESPATRVALRNIRDFAIPFKFEEKIMWRYAFTPEEEIEKILIPKKEEAVQPVTKKEEEIIIEEKEIEETKEIEPIRESIKPAKKEHKKPSVTKTEKKKSDEDNKTFMKEIEEFLEKKDTSIIAIEEVDKKKLIAVVESEEKKSMLFAFNKIKISEVEMLKCYKHAEKKNLPYQVIIRGSLSKKLSDTINAYQKLIAVEKLDF